MGTQDRLNRIAGIDSPEDCRKVLSFSPSALRSAKRRERLARERLEASKGRFSLGDMVEWNGWRDLHEGEIVEVIPAGRYPSKRPKLRVYGYYRDTESYVVECTGDGCYWPRVSSLKGVKDGIQ